MRALLWDVDGTLAETERDGHRVAFNEAFAALGLPWRWDEAHYGELLRVAGGRERLLHDMAGRADAPPERERREALAAELHAIKNRRYAAIVAEGRIPLRDGVPALMAEARAAGIAQAIVTTTSRANVEALLAEHLGARWAEDFAACVCAEDAPVKKPAPDAHRLALQRLGLAPPAALALEDSPAGVAAARAAGVAVVATRSAFFANDPLPGALAVGPGLHMRQGWAPALDGATGGVTLADLRAWHERRR